jgi:hypothetical protein
VAPVKPDSSSSMRSAIMSVATGVAAAIKHRLNVTMSSEIPNHHSLITVLAFKSTVFINAVINGAAQVVKADSSYLLVYLVRVDLSSSIVMFVRVGSLVVDAISHDLKKHLSYC